MSPAPRFRRRGDSTCRGRPDRGATDAASARFCGRQFRPASASAGGVSGRSGGWAENTPLTTRGALDKAPLANGSDWKRPRRGENGCRRDQGRRSSRGVPGWIPPSGPACLPPDMGVRPSGRSPPGSRKNCHSTCGPPPFSGLARVANGDDARSYSECSGLSPTGSAVSSLVSPSV